MHSSAELVRSVLRWSITVVSLDPHNSHRGPQLSQFCLGNLMSRADLATITAIAKEIAEIEKAEQTDVYMDSLATCIREQWGKPERIIVRRTGSEDSVMVASRLCTCLNKFGTVEQRSVLEVCCSVKTWKQAEKVFAGRMWYSIRDDFETIAKVFYNKESHTIRTTAEYITKISKKQ